MLAAAALALALGAVVLGSLTAPPPEAVPESTTTTTRDDVEQPIDLDNFTIAEIERGTPLEWSQTHSVTDGYPLGLIEHEGWIYVFVTRVPNFAAHGEGGLRVWRSTDGLQWEGLGEVIGPDHLIGGVHSTPQGLIAVERNREGGRLSIWRSTDGVVWSNEQVTISDSSSRLTTYAQSVGGNDRILVVSAFSGLDIPRMIEEATGLEVDSSRFGWGPTYDSDELGFVLWGPMGFPLAEISADELSLTDEELEILEAERSGGPVSEMWVSAESGQWSQGEIADASWVSSITATPGGQILATGWNSQGNVLWRTFDGFNWEEIDSGFGTPDFLEVWNGALVGRSGSGLASVVTSHDGLEWEPIGPKDHLPGLIQWSLGVMASGPGGIAANLHGWRSSTYVPSDEPVVLTDGLATLTIDYSRGSYRVDTVDVSRTWSMHSSRLPDGVTVDLDEEVVTFHAPETNEELASFTFDELVEAESGFWNQPDADTEHDGLVFTPNGQDWTIQDPSRWFDESILYLEVTDSRVVAAVVSMQGRFSPQTSPGFEIWSAAIP